MPVAQGGALTLPTLTERQKTEISGLLDEMTAPNELMRRKDSIFTSKNFHIDSRPMSSGTYKNYYKVDIQLKTGPTVAEIMLHPGATSIRDVRSGFTSCIADKHIYVVT